MKCAKVLKLSSRYLENDLDLPTREKIEQHLKECEKCNKEYNVFLKSLNILRAATKVKPTD